MEFGKEPTSRFLEKMGYHVHYFDFFFYTMEILGSLIFCIVLIRLNLSKLFDVVCGLNSVFNIVCGTITTREC